MILFLALLVLIVLISASLAYLSMGDFPRSPEDLKSDNSLFLIRNFSKFTPKLFLSLHQELSRKGLIVSLERLFKGSQSALVIYGSKELLKSFSQPLDLLELEDYANVKIDTSAWEFALRDPMLPKKDSLFSNFPKLENNEQVWYQMVLEAQKDNRFRTQIRVVVATVDKTRRATLFKALGGSKHFTKIAQPLSSQQILEFYQKRSMVPNKHFKLSVEEIIKLWRLPTVKLVSA